jgi:hypothetical protein
MFFIKINLQCRLFANESNEITNNIKNIEKIIANLLQTHQILFEEAIQDLDITHEYIFKDIILIKIILSRLLEESEVSKFFNSMSKFKILAFAHCKRILSIKHTIQELLINSQLHPIINAINLQINQLIIEMLHDCLSYYETSAFFKQLRSDLAGDLFNQPDLRTFKIIKILSELDVKRLKNELINLFLYDTSLIMFTNKLITHVKHYSNDVAQKIQQIDKDTTLNISLNKIHYHFKLMNLTISDFMQSVLRKCKTTNKLIFNSQIFQVFLNSKTPMELTKTLLFRSNNLQFSSLNKHIQKILELCNVNYTCSINILPQLIKDYSQSIDIIALRDYLLSFAPQFIDLWKDTENLTTKAEILSFTLRIIDIYNYLSTTKDQNDLFEQIIEYFHTMK